MKSNNLYELPANSKIFVDSNIPLYHLSGNYPSTTDFLEKVENRGYDAYINTITVSEITYGYIRSKLMELYKLRRHDFAKFVKSNPDSIRDIDLSPVEDILDIFIFVPMNTFILSLSFDLIRRYGLLSNDSINAATVIAMRIQNIATNDRDFERVGWIKVWKP